MKTNIAELLRRLENKGIKAQYICPDWVDPFVKVTSCGLLDRNSVADFIRRNGYNCDID